MPRHFLAALILIGLVVWARPEGERTTGHYYTPTAYVRIANQMILDPRGLLQYQCELNRIEPRFVPGSPEERWYENSYLKRDVDAFNESPRTNAHLFDIDGCELVGVSRTARTIPLPRSEDTAEWLGELRYAGGDVGATLRGAEQLIAVRQSPDRILAQDTLNVVVPPRRRPASLDGPEHIEGPIVRFFVRRPGAAASAVVADVRMIDRVGVLQDRRDQQVLGSHGTLIMGRNVPRGRLVALEDGDWVQFAAAGERATSRETFLYTTKDLTRLISSSTVRNGNPFRITQPDTLGMADGVVVAMDALVESGAAPPAWSEMNLELTLERGLQTALTERLRQVMIPRARRRSVPIRGAVTMMDVFTGDVLALASYPTQAEDLARFTYLSETRRAAYLQNQNFRVHPIGSAGKPFWGAALLHVYPQLEGFRVAAHEGRPDWPTAAGYPLSPGYETHNHPSLDYRGFLAHSCNKYLVDIATVALGINPGCEMRPDRGVQECLTFDLAVRLEPADQFRVGPFTAVHRPLLDRFLKDEQLVGLEQSRLFTTFRAVTGAETFGELAAERGRVEPGASPELFRQWYRNSRFYLTVWSRLLDPLADSVQADHDRRASVEGRLSAVSPEAANLSVNTIDRLRTEWINMLLGGGTALWNNVQLAESVSRLVSGTNLRANVVKQLELAQASSIDDRPRRELAELGLSALARRKTLEGMEAVIAEGTGRSLLSTSSTGEPAPALRARLQQLFPGHEFHLYAKTGTPRLELTAPRGYFRAVHSLFNTQGIAFDRAARQIRLTAAGKTGLAGIAPALHDDVLNLVEAFNDDPEAYEMPNGSKTRRAPLVIEDGRLRIQQPSSQSIVETKGGVFLLAVVATPRGVSSGDSRSSFGVSVVVYLEDTPANSEEAVVFARAMSDEIVEAMRERARSGASGSQVSGVRGQGSGRYQGLGVRRYQGSGGPR